MLCGETILSTGSLSEEDKQKVFYDLSQQRFQKKKLHQTGEPEAAGRQETNKQPIQ